MQVYRKEKFIFLLTVSTAIIAVTLGLIHIHESNSSIDWTTSHSPHVILPGITGITLLLLSIVASPVIITNHIGRFGIVVIAWSSIPLMIYLTKQIPMLRRICYIYFFVTHFAVIMGIWFLAE